MLQTIRERLTGWFAVFILGAIALTLVATFGNIDTGFTAGGAAASVNGEDIPMTDFRRIYQRQRQQWESNYRAQIPDALAQDLANQVVESLVRNRVVAQHVRSQGYRVNDDEIIATIESNPAFQVAGRFSRPAYESLLAAEGVSTARYEFEQRQDMEITQFIEGLGYTAFYTPAEFRRYIELDGETRDVDYAVLPSAAWLDKVELSEEEVAEFYELNKLNYMTEESVSLEYIQLSYNEILESIDISAAEVREYYDANPQEFAGPEERKASHILIAGGGDDSAAAAEAEALKVRLDAGEDFASLAAQYSADTGSAGNGGDLGWLGMGDSPAPEFEEALFALVDGETSAPVQTPFGYHLIRLDGLRPGNTREFEEVQAELITQLQETEAADIFAARADELDELALESMDGLATVAEQLDEPLGTIDGFTRSGGQPLGFQPALVETVFSLEVLEDGENSPVIDLGEGRAVVVRVTEYREAEIRSLEDVRESIEAQMRNERAISLASVAGDALLGELNADVRPDLPGDAEWQQVEGLRRGAQDVPADLAAAIFQAAKPGSDSAGNYQGLLLASGDFALYRVTASSPGRPDLYTLEDRDLRKQQLAGRLGGSQATALVETLVEEASVAIEGDLLGLEDGLL